jgi:hypothetical protein
MWQNIVLLVKVIREVIRFIRRVNAFGKDKFSVANGKRVRVLLEYRLWQIASGNDAGWRKLITLDDDFTLFCQTVLKSVKIDHLLHGDTLTREKVLAAFREAEEIQVLGGPEIHL